MSHLSIDTLGHL